MDEKKSNSTQLLQQIKSNLEKLKPTSSKADFLKVIKQIQSNLVSIAQKSKAQVIVQNHGMVSIPKPGWFDLTELESLLEDLNLKLEAEKPLNILMEKVKSGTIIGEADPKATESDASWRIRKSFEKDGINYITYAEDNSDFTHKWSERFKLKF